MGKQNIFIDGFVKEQLEKWEKRKASLKHDGSHTISVITVSTEPGSGGRVVAEETAKRLNFDYFYRDIIKGIATSAKCSASVIDSVEKERLTGVEDFISCLVRDKYLYPGSYLKHLIKVVSSVARHGQAMIVGRGANFILPAETRLSVRIISPLEKRIKNVAREHKTTLETARNRVITRESKRSAFIKQSYNENVSDPLNYELVLNTGNLDIDAAVDAIASTFLKINNKPSV